MLSPYTLSCAGKHDLVQNDKQLEATTKVRGCTLYLLYLHYADCSTNLLAVLLKMVLHHWHMCKQCIPGRIWSYNYSQVTVKYAAHIMWPACSPDCTLVCDERCWPWPWPCPPVGRRTHPPRDGRHIVAHPARTCYRTYLRGGCGYYNYN